MAGGIFAILDDVAMLLDDAAVMSKVAAKKTAGILGDDLAVNAEKATGFHASRELPVIWAITKGSFINKLIILPVALLLSAYLPGLIVPVLLIGGAYLSYEGVEKLYEMFTGGHGHEEIAARETGERQELLQREAAKIKAAVRTDFILSIEIIVIALGTVVEHPLLTQVMVVSLIALLATVGVYGLVALLVRMDDAGVHLITRAGSRTGPAARGLKALGQFLVAALPRVIRLLGVVGTIAMLLVGGGMYVHNIGAVHHLLEALPSVAGELLAGLVVGALMVGAVHLVRGIRAKAAVS
jgi:predicted DNA repair protein MutK